MQQANKTTFSPSGSNSSSPKHSGNTRTSNPKISIPCKYFLSGTCRLGEECRFSHVKNGELDRAAEGTESPRSLYSTLIGGASLQSLKKHFDHVSLLLLGRRPLLHIIILFAADVRVRKYAEEVQEIFLQNGINVFTQTETAQQHHIKPENLLEIITSSTANFVIVLGDRNMKNRTCQAKKSGKLVETDVEEHVEMIATDWAQTHPMRGKVDPLNVECVEDLTGEQIIELIQAFSGLKNISTNKISKLEQEIEDLQSWKFPHSISADSNQEPPFFLDDKTLARLTKLQNNSIHIHRDLTAACEAIKLVPIDNNNAGNSQRGILLTYEHEDHQIGISNQLQEAMVNTCEKLLTKVERLGDQLSAIANKSPLWESYKQQEIHARTKKNIVEKKNATVQSKTTKKQNAHKADSSQIKKWKCEECAFLNESQDRTCVSCHSQLQQRIDEGDWSVSSKKQKKKQEVPQQSQKQGKQEKQIEERKRILQKKQQPEPIVTPQPQIKSPILQPSSIARSSSTTVAPHTPVLAAANIDSSSSSSSLQAIPNAWNAPMNNLMLQGEKPSIEDHVHPGSYMAAARAFQNSPTSQKQISRPVSPAVDEKFQLGFRPPIAKSGVSPQIAVGQTKSFSTSTCNQSPQSIPIQLIPPIQNVSRVASSSPANLSDNDIWGSGFHPLSAAPQQTGTQPLCHIPQLEYQPSLSPYQEQIWEPLMQDNGYNDEFDMWNIPITGSFYSNYPTLHQPMQPQPTIKLPVPPIQRQQTQHNSSIEYELSNLMINNNHDEKSLCQQPVNVGKEVLTNEAITVPTITAYEGQEVVPVKQTPTTKSPAIANRPCAVCGEESLLECNLCSSLRRRGITQTSTFFCSSEHQILVWKEHQKWHASHFSNL